MAGFFILFMGAVVGGLALVVFLCALPFLLKVKRETNRFGAPSTTGTVGQAIASGFARAFDFTGRSNRLDFWVFAIFIGFLCGLVFVMTIILVVIMRDEPTWYSATPFLLIPLLAIPSLSMAVRRLHDVNRSGWWLSLLLVFGYFILLFWFFQPAHKGASETAEVFE